MHRYALLIAVCFGVGVAQSQAVLQSDKTGTIDLTGVVKSVASRTPDVTGNVDIPSAFNGTTCTGCTMVDPVS